MSVLYCLFEIFVICISLQLFIFPLRLPSVTFDIIIVSKWDIFLDDAVMWGQFWSQKSRKPTQVLKMDYVALDVEELLSLSLYVGMRRGTSFDLISANAFILPILCIFPTPIQLTPNLKF